MLGLRNPLSSGASDECIILLFTCFHLSVQGRERECLTWNQAHFRTDKTEGISLRRRGGNGTAPDAASPVRNWRRDVVTQKPSVTLSLPKRPYLRAKCGFKPGPISKVELRGRPN